MAPMSFMIEEARRHLEKHGFVYTLRPFKRKHVSKDWYNLHRGGKKMGDINVKFIRKIRSTEELQAFVYYSGFKTLENWLKKAKDSKFLYYVRVLK